MKDKLMDLLAGAVVFTVIMSTLFTLVAVGQAFVRVLTGI